VLCEGGGAAVRPTSSVQADSRRSRLSGTPSMSRYLRHAGRDSA
jgi:hypothetical protein